MTDTESNYYATRRDAERAAARAARSRQARDAHEDLARRYEQLLGSRVEESGRLNGGA